MSLNQTLNNIGYTLALSSASWNEKLDAIRRLGDILRSDGDRMTGSEIDVNIKLGLCSATNDNRSQIVTEACSTIITMCGTFGQRVENVCSEIFVNIFDKAAAGNSVVSNTVSSCCVNMVSLVIMERIISQMDRYLNSRRASDKVQLSAANCLRMMIEIWPETIIKKHHKTISQLIDSGLKAPRSEVRSIMRELSSLFSQQYGSFQEDNRITMSSSIRRTYLASSTNSGAQLPPNQNTTIKHMSPVMKSFSAQSRIHCTPKSVEVASKKTGIEPRTIPSTPISNRQTSSVRTTPTSFQRGTQPVSSRLSSRDYTVSSSVSRAPISPVPRRQIGQLSTHSSANKDTLVDHTYTASVPIDRRLTTSAIDRVKPDYSSRQPPVTASRITSSASIVPTTPAHVTVPTAPIPTLAQTVAPTVAPVLAQTPMFTPMPLPLPLPSVYHSSVEKKLDMDEIVRKLSSSSLGESELLASRVNMIKAIMEASTEMERVTITNNVIFNVEDTVKRLQSTIDLVKSLL